jgi:hypothetical protein
MSSYFDELQKSGKKILEDTKTPALIKKKATKPVGAMDAPTETDPHKVLIKRTISEKPKKSELVEDFKKFITAAEAEL